MAGRLIVSMPQLNDGPFAQSVIYICTHDIEHAFGLILNKPIEGVVATEAVADMEEKDIDLPLFFGGPCEPRRGIILHSDQFVLEDSETIGAGLAISTTNEALAALGTPLLPAQSARLFTGHAGWGPGQLDDELRRHTWLDLETSTDFAFSDPETMWDRAMAEIGIPFQNLTALGTDKSAGSRPLI